MGECGALGHPAHLGVQDNKVLRGVKIHWEEEGSHQQEGESRLQEVQSHQQEWKSHRQEGKGKGSQPGAEQRG